jgi:hypothetical protein
MPMPALPSPSGDCPATIGVMPSLSLTGSQLAQRCPDFYSGDPAPARWSLICIVGTEGWSFYRRPAGPETNPTRSIGHKTLSRPDGRACSPCVRESVAKPWRSRRRVSCVRSSEVFMLGDGADRHGAVGCGQRRNWSGASMRARWRRAFVRIAMGISGWKKVKSMIAGAVATLDNASNLPMRSIVAQAPAGQSKRLIFGEVATPTSPTTRKKSP